ncbi:MAG TPA: alpha/beta fold hydrolase [Solirubrobacteraceae bacterium]|nr:alpha/beta fold hydrolase [Solirubrobacteraceae bacterium]
MRRAARTFATAFLAILGCTALWSSSAQAQIEWKPCAGTNEVACGHLTVPVDPSGAIPGTITLAMRRHLSPVGNAKTAVIALAGGPGQSAIPFTNDFTQILGPVVSTRDLIVFDQRGTGLSYPLSCAAFEHIKGGITPLAVSICAGQIGQTRGLYTTADTVADIEAIRQAGGYEKLVLYGTSYGTKVAERYAQEYPSHVEALVLDSVVPTSGRNAFEEPTFTAVGRILRQLCSAGACTHITPEPVADLARLVKRMGGGSLSGRFINGRGHAEPVRIYANDLLGILMEGDFNPILRAEFPAAVRSAVDGDTAALARLLAHADSGEEDEGEESLSEGFDTPLYYSTICEESVFPWNRSSSSKARLREALFALRTQSANAFAPFTPANALALSDVVPCASWPFASPGPEVDEAPFPNVPTLILSGADDLRTPTANAREVAAQIPDAQLLVVPNTGHSVLGADPTPCAHNALQALFEGKPVQQCKDRTPPALALPTPLPPRNLSAVPRARASHGKTGVTLDAAVITLADCDRQLLLTLLAQAGSESLQGASARAGGLLSGWCGISGATQLLRGYSYVPGVTLSGKVSSGTAKLSIGGSAAARGTITITRGALSGVLAGQRVHLSAAGATEVERGASTLTIESHLADLTATPERFAALRSAGTGALLRYLLH